MLEMVYDIVLKLYFQIIGKVVNKFIQLFKYSRIKLRKVKLNSLIKVLGENVDVVYVFRVGSFVQKIVNSRFFGDGWINFFGIEELVQQRRIRSKDFFRGAVLYFGGFVESFNYCLFEEVLKSTLSF